MQNFRRNMTVSIPKQEFSEGEALTGRAKADCPDLLYKMTIGAHVLFPLSVGED